MRYSRLLVLASLLSTTPLVAQSWQYTGSVHQARRMFTTNVLGDSRVLAAGGWDENVRARATSELFDPATASWTLAGDMHVARARHSATLLPDGRVVVIGGQTGLGGEGNFPVQTATIETFDPATGTWTVNCEAGLARQNHAAALLPDGRILIIGGLTGASPTASCEYYDPATQSVSPAPSLPSAKTDLDAVTLGDGRVMLIGGRSGAWNGDYYSTTEIFDPATETWTEVSAMHEARTKGCYATFSDGTVLACGGRNTPTSDASTSEVFDGSTWSSTSDMNLPVSWSGSSVIPTDRYLISGGIIDAVWNNSAFVSTTSTTEWFDKAHGSWYFAPQMNKGREEHCQVYLHQTVNTSLPADLVLVVSGRYGEKTVTSDSTYYGRDSIFMADLTPTCEVLDVSQPALLTYMRHQPAASVDQSIAEHQCPVLAVVNTQIPYLRLSVPEQTDCRVELFDMLGRNVGELCHGTFSPGSYALSLDPTLADGAYIARLTTPLGVTTCKVLR